MEEPPVPTEPRRGTEPGSPSGSSSATDERFATYAATRSPIVRAELIAEHLGLAQRLARRFARHHESVDDLYQVAALGLIKAVDGFRPDLGHSFIAYAVPTILGELKRYFRDQGWAVRAPRRLQELHLRVQQASDELSQELRRAPRPRDLAERLNISEEEVLEAGEAARAYRWASIDAQSDQGEPLSATLPSVDVGLELADDITTIGAGIRALPARERRILELRFLHDCTQSEIAREVGLSQMQISRLLSRSLATLRRAGGERTEGPAPQRHRSVRRPRTDAATQARRRAAP